MGQISDVPGNFYDIIKMVHREKSYSGQIPDREKGGSGLIFLTGR
jgi:hypothetical protein